MLVENVVFVFFVRLCIIEVDELSLIFVDVMAPILLKTLAATAQQGVYKL